MPITHVLVIVENQSDVDNMINGLQKIGEFGGAALIVTTTVQSAINILAVDCEGFSSDHKLNG